MNKEKTENLVSPQGDTILIHGKLSFETVAVIYSKTLELLAKQAYKFIDLRGVTHSDSSGLALLLAWIRHAKLHNRQLQFANVPETMLVFARICEVDEFLPIVP